jgi:hypothetical protein
MLGVFTSAKTSGDTFIDSFSNDVIIRTSTQSQRVLFGFSSNTSSLMRMGASNINIGWSNVITSNIGTLCITSNVTVDHVSYASNVYIGTANTFTHSNFRLYITGNARLDGDLYVNGTITNINTNVNVTDQFLVSNTGTGPALIVNQYGSHPVALFNLNSNATMMIDYTSFVAIGSNIPQSKLDVQGSIIARGDITSSNIFTSNTITTSVTTSNVFINNNLIIDHTGLVQNSNYIPVLDATKIIGGDSAAYSFSSNFIRNRHIITSKIESNVSLGGALFMDGFVHIGVTTSNFQTGHRLLVNNGDILIQGSNNFVSTGHHARINLGNNSTFIGASRDVGIVFQTSNSPSPYPMILTNDLGRLGVGIVDPSEQLHLIGNAKVSSNLYVLNAVGVNTSNPSEALTVNLGNAKMSSNAYVMNAIGVGSSNPSAAGVWISHTASNPVIKIQYSNKDPFTMQQDSNGTLYMTANSNDIHIQCKENVSFGFNSATTAVVDVRGNIKSRAYGSIGPMIMLLPPITYTDVPVGGLIVFDNTIEAGNDTANQQSFRGLFHASSFLLPGHNFSGEDIRWNEARLIFRGMSLTYSNNEVSTLKVKEYYYDRVPQYADVTAAFSLSNAGRDYGYSTVITPWFIAGTSNVRHLAMEVVSATHNSQYRFGSVYIQFRA